MFKPGFSAAIASVMCSGVLASACANGSTSPLAPTRLSAGLGAASASARPSAACDNVEATVSAVFTSGTTAAGVISGDLNGDVTAAIHDIRASGDGALHVQMEHHYITAAGQIDTADHAVLAPVDAEAGLYRMNNRLTIVGGTGVYANASGYLHTHGEVDFSAGTIELALRGRVCR